MSTNKPKCLCTFAQRMQGDGCHIRNPEKAKELTEKIKGPYSVIKTPLTVCDSRRHKLPPMK